MAACHETWLHHRLLRGTDRAVRGCVVPASRETTGHLQCLRHTRQPRDCWREAPHAAGSLCRHQTPTTALCAMPTRSTLAVPAASGVTCRPQARCPCSTLRVCQVVSPVRAGRLPPATVLPHFSDRRPRTTSDFRHNFVTISSEFRQVFSSATTYTWDRTGWTGGRRDAGLCHRTTQQKTRGMLTQETIL